VQNGTYQTKYLYLQALIESGAIMDRRAHIIASGRVQKASYRIFVDRIAFELDLKGMVRNLKDGTVEIIIEGPEEKLDEFTRLINVHKYPIRVDSLQKKFSRATGEFKDFDIIKDGRSDSDLEGKIDLGTVFLQDISAKQDVTIQALKSVGTDVKAVSIDVKTMDGHLTHMDSNMGTRFDRLDKKYVEFGKTMKSVRKDTKTMASDIKVIRKEATIGRKKPATG
jgi:acylphosphatase/uncharacterized protein (UPF0335 family)